MIAKVATHQAIERTLYRYCAAIDSSDYETFAGLFKHGQWFMVDHPGPEPVRKWLEENVLLYDGRTMMRHQITNLQIDEEESGREASFTCCISLWQGLDDFPIQPIFFGRFSGTFALLDGEWWWQTNRVDADLVGVMSRHLRNWDQVRGSVASA